MSYHPEFEPRIHPRLNKIDKFTTQELLSELKKRYRTEPAVMDYIEMIECEL